MKLLPYLTYNCLFCLLLIKSVYIINCDQLSTVFVLETSDSVAADGTNTEISTSGTAAKSPNTDDAKIITDSSEPFLASQPESPTEKHQANSNKQSHVIVHNSDSNHNKKPTSNYHQSTSAPANHDHHSSSQSSSSSTNHPTSANTGHHNNNQPHQQATARRLDEASNLVTSTHHPSSSASTNHNQQQQYNSNNNNNHHNTNTPAHNSQQQHSPQAQAHHQSQQHNSKPANHQQSTPSSHSQDHHVKQTTRPVHSQQAAPTSHNNNNHNHNSTNKPKEHSSTSQPGREEAASAKNEENRLLIEITSGDDDYSTGTGYNNNNIKPPKKNNVLGISTSNDGIVVGGPDENGKRKPTIKLVISTGNNKNHNKPSIAIIEPSDDGAPIVYTERPESNVNNNNGYINPASYHSSSTRRPVFVNTNNNNNGDVYSPSINQPLAGNSNSNYQINGGESANETPIKPNPNDYYDKDATTNRPSVTSHRPAAVHNNNNNNHHIVTHQPVAVTDNYNYGADNSNQDNSYLTNNQQNTHNNNNNDESQGNSLYPLNEKNCGLQFEKTRIVGGEEANPDDFLWMAAIIKSKPSSDTEVRPFCGGSLITRRHILTAAHCLENLAPRDVLVRLGSYDFDDATASSLSADYAIDQFRVPASYSKKTHMADIAIMRLKTPLSLEDNYKTVCMPQARRAYVGAQATVTGYGSQSQQFKKASPKLRQVTIPIWENRRCSAVYKRNFTDSYLCAGYETGGADACQGDSGGPLMTLGPNEKMMVVGVVSFGIGCGQPNYPGVYTRVTNYLDWIARNTKE